jgi:hypothetical protein
MDCLGRRARLVSVHTEIFFDDDGILEIYHVSRKATKTDVRSGERILGKVLPVYAPDHSYINLGQVTASRPSSA